MFRVRILFVVAVLTAGNVGAMVFERVLDHKDDSVYNRIIMIEGSAEIVNSTELGTRTGSGQFLVFQREDCKRCLIGTWTDKDGKYKIFVGRGRYKVIMRHARGGGEPSFDMLAPDQPRYIEAHNVVQGHRFDIKIVAQPDR